MYTNKRILSFIIDSLILTIVFMICNIVPFIDEYFSTQNFFEGKISVIYSISLLACTICFFSRDLIAGQSLGKKICKIKVVSKNSEEAKIWQRLIRNITFFIWPLEFLLLLLEKNTIGDLISCSKIISTKIENSKNDI